MRKRAIFLLILGLLLPGSPQLLAGNRLLGKVGIRATFVGWASLAVLTILFFVKRSWVLTILATPALGGIVSIILYAYGFGFAILLLDAFRLSLLGRLYPVGRYVMISLFLIFAFLGASVFVTGANTLKTADNTVEAIFAQKGFTSASDGRYNILLLGSDAGRDRFGVRPDSISVLSFNADTGAMVNIGIPRNLQHAPIPADSPLRKFYGESWDDLINAIYKNVTDNHPDAYPDAVKNGSTPGIEATRDLVEGVTGLKIQSYVMVNMTGFKKLIDAVGGLTIDVKQRLPIGGQLDDGSDATGWIEPGVQTLDGRLALWYARSRHGTSDYSRMARQHQVEQLIIKKLTPSYALAHFDALAEAAKTLIDTDIPDGMAATYADLALNSKSKRIRSVELVPKYGFEPDVPNYEKIHTAIAVAIKASK
ncbi:MAG: LCP family protein [Rhodoluna sp.]|nr:LCP family protein [Rhodoluna sp.]